MRLDNRLLLILLLIMVYQYGWRILGWDFDYSKLLAIFLFGILTQTLFCLAFKIPVNAAISTVITTLLLGLLIRTEYIFICGMLSFFAISSKYIFQFRGKHLFNPANFGLVYMMLFTQQAFISHHRIDIFLMLLFILVTLWILYRSAKSRMDVILFYVFLYALFYGLFCLAGFSQKPLEWNSLWFLIYIFILLADPLSNPNSRLGRILWVCFIVVLTFLFDVILELSNAHFYALAAGGLLTPLLDELIKGGSRFSWDSVYRRVLHSNDPQSPLNNVDD